MVEWYVYAILAILSGTLILPSSINAPPRPFVQKQAESSCTKVGAWCFNKHVTFKSSECSAALADVAAGGKLDPSLFCK